MAKDKVTYPAKGSEEVVWLKQLPKYSLQTLRWLMHGELQLGEKTTLDTWKINKN